jgi:hypothetical protein
VERWRDTQRGTGREIQAGGGGDTGELFDDLDFFLLLQGYPQKYMPLLDFKDGPEECRFEEIGESRSEQSARPRVAVPDEGKSTWGHSSGVMWRVNLQNIFTPRKGSD